MFVGLVRPRPHTVRDGSTTLPPSFLALCGRRWVVTTTTLWIDGTDSNSQWRIHMPKPPIDLSHPPFLTPTHHHAATLWAAPSRRRECTHSKLLFGSCSFEAASCRATRVLGAGKTFCARKSVTRRRGAALSTRQTRKAVSGRLVQKDPLGGGLGSWGWSKTPTNRQTMPFKLGKFCPVRA